MLTERSSQCREYTRRIWQSSGRKWLRMFEPVAARMKPSKEFEPAMVTICNWAKQIDLDEGRRADRLTTDERNELAHMRREKKRLRFEREILAKAAA